MAQKGVQLDQEIFSCSICLDLLKDPVTTPCGHSYCMNCIKRFWDEQDEKKIHSCPQCRQTFTPRPVLVKSTMLADLVEELKKTGLQAAPADHCYAGPEDVACDVCTGRKLKALKSCLVCLASYCEKHLQRHDEVTSSKKHKLVEPSKKLQENICSRHDEVMKMFCRTDQQSICYLCSVDEHKGHDTVSAAAERTERQRELEVSRQNIQQRIQDREKDVKVLQQEVEAINGSADKAVEDSEKIFTELIRLMEKRRSDVKQQVRSQQETEVSRVKELQEKLEQEITELKRKDAELKQLSHTEDHNQFLHNYPSVSALSESTDSSSIKKRPLRYFEDVTAAVSEVRDKLQDVLSKKWTNVLLTVTEVDVLLSQPEPKTRAGFLKYSCDITLDPNTANTCLLLSGGNRKATVVNQQQSYSRHPDRFTMYLQVLSKESLNGRCYWEVEWRGGGVCVAVAYKNIKRAGSLNEIGFGRNDKSWALYCDRNSSNFWYNKVQTPVSGPWSPTVGVYLDHSAGILSFYSVSETMTLLHRVQTTFTQPLYAGLWFYYWSSGDTAELYKRNLKGRDHSLFSAINGSADKAVEDSEKIFTELIRLMEKRRSDVKQQVRSQQETEVSRVKELQEKLEQEITELKRKDAELKQLSHTEDHNQFLHNYPSVSALSESTDSSSIKKRPLRYFEDVTAAVSEVRDKLQDVLSKKWTNVSLTVTEVDVLLPHLQPEPKTRAGFLKYSREITLDPNTAYTKLLLSEGNRKATGMREAQCYSSHPDRFTRCCQVLSKESLTGRCYWEVEWRGGGVCVAVAYKNIKRAGGAIECEFGQNDKSWTLRCDKNGYNILYNEVQTPVSGPWSPTVGVYLDHRAGILSFYSVSETMTLLHRVQTIFTQPLYAGLRILDFGDTAEFCELR
ncbi:tripartite motif-containing protein 16-like [Micropterus dolomieu]|uniref:tripartite motif-containing protein 16-like n=1 Tax=Micropterus dolomieu TaxID=147949 RepID=UPI001E8EA2AA|nr:tripartite motif-containing protein 16-like [Micropterus dolomieu]